jgi:hypothetical protein
MDTAHRIPPCGRRRLRTDVGGRGFSLRVASVLISAALLAGCTDRVAGAPLGSHSAAGSEPNVALMDTGDYPITAGHAYGTAGSSGNPTNAAALLEAHRLAENVVGPWQVDATLREQQVLVTQAVAPETSALVPTLNSDDAEHALAAIVLAHGYVTGFASGRNSPGGHPQRALKNVVLMFADPASASAAAAEMAGKAGAVILGATARPVKIDMHPEALAAVADAPDPNSVKITSFAPHGRYVLYQWAELTGIDQFDAALRIPNMVLTTLNLQVPLIDRFIPTDPAKLPDLPLDPTGQLLARTLWMPDGKAPVEVGAWQPSAWLHFERDPVAAAAEFTKANVQVVTQRWAKVYQTPTAADAARLLDQYGGQIHDLLDVTPVGAVAGFPGAKCFQRTKAWASATELITVQQAIWHYSCIAAADRYVFQTFSDREGDVKQQISAQYRILAGK